ncbi:hypothetical protein [Lacimicrobium alkaliphilum]|uniref:Copper resistance protein CopB n=1 Tax=Lacimicrobium alkaliphilum TaxID=1526571 RepID=A0A0U2Z8X9_9ALTE|nr:hypothetical protein [Lacimicrobium alkaliphilum]ALS98884.1 hypothetical protein AT746_11790 [Lacimicrobium alkaliphilum]
MNIRINLFCSLCLLAMVVPFNLKADGQVVDRIYHPYVLANEHRVEWRFMSRQTDDENFLAQRIGFGHSINDRWILELYLIGERDIDGDFGLEAYELEARWMMTEQGRYWADWGMVFELEKRQGSDQWETASGLVLEKEFGRNSLTLNWFMIYEWGREIQDELESEFRLQYRYRWMPQVQPSIELYSGEDYIGIGPALMGLQRFDGQKQLKWELGFITELSNIGKDHTLRFVLEYEF